jgi:hypothetical protein
VPTLKGTGPFTVFAPTNAAFAALPAGTVDTLLKPENKPALTKVLTYHVVAGKMDSAALTKAIDAGGGKATLTEVSGGTLTATRSGTMIMLSDESGGWPTSRSPTSSSRTASSTSSTRSSCRSDGASGTGERSWHDDEAELVLERRPRERLDEVGGGARLGRSAGSRPSWPLR